MSSIAFDTIPTKLITTPCLYSLLSPLAHSSPSQPTEISKRKKGADTSPQSFQVPFAAELRHVAQISGARWHGPNNSGAFRHICETWGPGMHKYLLLWSEYILTSPASRRAASKCRTQNHFPLTATTRRGIQVHLRDRKIQDISDWLEVSC